MRIDLSGKKAVVSGSTAGIGFGIVQGLAAAGAEVVITGRTRQRVDQAIERLKADLPDVTAHGVEADLGTAEGCQALIDAHPEADILVNNVGIFRPTPFFDIPDEDWEQFFQVNVMSAVRLSRHYAQGMKKRDWGRVLFLSSESALNIPTEMVHYGMTKSAVQSISRGLAKVLSGTKVTVNAVLPGPTRSEGVGKMLHEMAEEKGLSEQEMEERFVKENRPTSIIQRVADVEEVANMVVYLASPQASATTGAALRVEGGIVDTMA
ncbi:MAG: SDR family oxidoreductase [Alcanivorax sp.]|uniref:SDR family oxidoreductase n=1 Tax=Alloalcanivorax marinus TaxID=1177169 RepID=A0A9Q3UHV1_9GAMM|nr:SDR family oxidoreductase [Alloalcanivorax marinus]MBM7332206.1 SDR family oxidoreductase [Alloalcanivorax marinus]MCC4307461.1 SDR family oxidoreductase [Alloalcanivorax marinus]MCU5785213.1 short-chain dehydrogenase/reductase SDR [Alloalcanivorax marinus]